MKRVNLDPNADFVGNRPPKPKGVQLIRRHDQRRPMIDIEKGDVEAAVEQRRKAILEEKERSRAEHQAKLEDFGELNPCHQPGANGNNCNFRSKRRASIRAGRSCHRKSRLI